MLSTGHKQERLSLTGEQKNESKDDPKIQEQPEKKRKNCQNYEQWTASTVAHYWTVTT